MIIQKVLVSPSAVFSTIYMYMYVHGEYIRKTSLKDAHNFQKFTVKFWTV